MRRTSSKTTLCFLQENVLRYWFKFRRIHRIIWHWIWQRSLLPKMNFASSKNCIFCCCGDQCILMFLLCQLFSVSKIWLLLLQKYNGHRWAGTHTLIIVLTHIYNFKCYIKLHATISPGREFCAPNVPKLMVKMVSVWPQFYA